MRLLWSAALAAALGAGACHGSPVDVAGLASPDLTRNLVAHWTFDEGSGTVLHDRSGNARDGTVAGAAWIPGQFGGALRFQGADMVSVPSFPAATNGWSVSLWAYIGTADVPPIPPAPGGPPGSGVSISVLVSTMNMNGGWVVNTAFSATDRHYRFGYVAAPGGMSPASGECGCLTVDHWTHLAVVFDDVASTLQIYDGSTLATTVPTSGPISAGDTTLYFGRWANGNGLFFTGALDDVAIYSRALVPEEVASLANGAAPDP